MSEDTVGEPHPSGTSLNSLSGDVRGNAVQAREAHFHDTRHHGVTIVAIVAIAVLAGIVVLLLVKTRT
jgi:hypothetical protein